MVHNDHREFPALKQHEGHQAHKTESAGVVPEVEIMKDDEGTEANVASSIALSEVRITPALFFLNPGVQLNNYG
jgi:hypothetical protein